MFTTSTRSATTAGDGATYELDPDEPASMGIVRAVTSVSERSSAAEDGDGTLPPLFETVDPDALDDLVASRRDDQRSTVEVAFEYAGHTVTVQGTEPVTVSVE